MDVYAELATYLNLIEAKNESFATSRDRLESYRRLNNIAKQINFWLKYLSTFGLILPFCILLVSNSMISVNSLIQIFMGSLLTKLFCALVDLETKYVQYAVLVCIAILFLISNPESSFSILSVSSFFIFFITFSRHAKSKFKVHALALMVTNPDQFHDYLRDKDTKLLTLYKENGISRFDDPSYKRTFSVKTFKKKQQIEATSTPMPTNLLPSGKTVRAEIWKREPYRDLSSIHEFFVCCFLGGSQDASVFDFILSKRVTMLDLVSPKGRTIRALMMACLAGERSDCRPVLVVNAVFGREGGLVGAGNDDNAFIKQQIEAYARFAGFTQVLYNQIATNKRPRLFIEYLQKQIDTKTTRLKCRLFPSPDRIKLEIFNRREPRANVYLMLLLEIMNLTDNYASKGKVSGITVDLRNTFLATESCTQVNIVGTEFQDLAVGNHCLQIAHCFVGGTSTMLLQQFFRFFSELDTTVLPQLIIVKHEPGLSALGVGTCGYDKINIHPVVATITEPFWLQVIFSITVCQHFLWHLHPCYSEEMLFTFLDTTIPDLNQRILESAEYLKQLEEILALTNNNFITKLIGRAVRKKYKVDSVFKYKAIYQFLKHNEKTGTTTVNCTNASLAKGMFQHKLDNSGGFRAQFFQGLSAEQKQLVHEVMISELEKMFAEVNIESQLPDHLDLTNCADTKAKIYRFEKLGRRCQLVFDDASLTFLAQYKEQCILLGKLIDVERLLVTKKIAKGKTMLADIIEKNYVEIKKHKLISVVNGIKGKIRTAPFTNAVEKFNLEMYW